MPQQAPSATPKLPPPPRRVRRSSARLALWGPRLFILPHQLVGLAALAVLLFLLLAQLQGTTLPAHVTSATTSYSSKHGTTYTIHYQYTTPTGQTASDADPVTQQQYDQLKPPPPPPPRPARRRPPPPTPRPRRAKPNRGSKHRPTPPHHPGSGLPHRGATSEPTRTNNPLHPSRLTLPPTTAPSTLTTLPSPPPRPVTIHYFSLGPFHHAKLIPSKDSPRTLIGFLALWATFWNAIVGLFTYILWIKPLRDRRLLKFGLVAPGTLTHKSTRRGKNNTTYLLEYTFPDPMTRRLLHATWSCPSQSLWTTAQLNQPLTILYDPNHPARRNLPYEFSAYQILPDQPLLMPR